jgi:hypothetical protein
MDFYMEISILISGGGIVIEGTGGDRNEWNLKT